MSKVVTVGATTLFVCILCATPLSLRFSPERIVSLSVDSASAVIGRPLTPMSIAGVNRRAHRRALPRELQPWQRRIITATRTTTMATPATTGPAMVV